MAEPIVIHAETCNGDTYEIRYYRASDYDALAAENERLRYAIKVERGKTEKADEDNERLRGLLRDHTTGTTGRSA